MSRHNLLSDYEVLASTKVHLACSESQAPSIPHPTSPPSLPLHCSLVDSLMWLPYPIFLSMTSSYFIVLPLAPVQPWTRKCIMHNNRGLFDHLTSCHVSQFQPFGPTHIQILSSTPSFSVLIWQRNKKQKKLTHPDLTTNIPTIYKKSNHSLSSNTHYSWVE